MGRLAQLVLRGPAVLAVEAVAGDEAADTAHGDTRAEDRWGRAGTWRGRGGEGGQSWLREETAVIAEASQSLGELRPGRRHKQKSSWMGWSWHVPSGDQPRDLGSRKMHVSLNRGSALSLSQWAPLSFFLCSLIQQTSARSLLWDGWLLLLLFFFFLIFFSFFNTKNILYWGTAD